MQNAPSGIAQLRKSSQQNKQTEDAQMDLDDFLVPSSIGTPAGVSPEASALPNESSVSTTTSISAIPIKQGSKSQVEEFQVSRASAPSISVLEQNRTDPEFSYVPRHVRKTSIDERRVSCCSPSADAIY